VDDDKEAELEEGRMPLLDHLIELRNRLMWAIGAVLVAFLICYQFKERIYGFLVHPLAVIFEGQTGRHLIYTGLTEAFFTYVKVSFWAGICLAFPIVASQIWKFVAPGLYEHEKKLAAPLVIGSTVLFLLGVAFCYYFVFGRVFAFIHGFAPKSITPAPDIEAYFSFVITMFLAFGVTFEIPIAVIVLVRMGVVSVEQLKRWPAERSRP